jgi:hypothetical protein
LEFLLYTDTFLQEIGIVAKTNDNVRMSDDGSEDVSDASSRLSDGK